MSIDCIYSDFMKKDNVSECCAIVIVTYYPSDEVIELISKAARVVDNIIVVDNTDSPALNLIKLERICNVIYMQRNSGIACALNVGANYAFNAGFQFVVFFDQDSVIDEVLIKELLNAILKFNKEDNVAIVGPSYFDTRLGKKAPFIKFNRDILCRIEPEGNGFISVDYLITSGSIISREAWNSIGPTDESLFIDYVDIEWCLRAKNKGWQVVGAPYIVMEHTLGDEPINVFGRKLPVHSPIRHYYFFRNCISLLKRDYIPFGFKLREFLFLPVRFFIYSLFTRDKVSHVNKMMKGLLDGFLSKSGPYR